MQMYFKYLTKTNRLEGMSLFKFLDSEENKYWLYFVVPLIRPKIKDKNDNTMLILLNIIYFVMLIILLAFSFFM